LAATMNAFIALCLFAYVSATSAFFGFDGGCNVIKALYCAKQLKNEVDKPDTKELIDKLKHMKPDEINADIAKQAFAKVCLLQKEYGDCLGDKATVCAGDLVDKATSLGIKIDINKLIPLPMFKTIGNPKEMISELASAAYQVLVDICVPEHQELLANNAQCIAQQIKEKGTTLEECSKKFQATSVTDACKVGPTAFKECVRPMLDTCDNGKVSDLVCEVSDIVAHGVKESGCSAEQSSCK